MCRGEFGEETALCRSPGSGWDRTFPFARPRRLPKRMGKVNRSQKQQDHNTNRKERKAKQWKNRIHRRAVIFFLQGVWWRNSVSCSSVSQSTLPAIYQKYGPWWSAPSTTYKADRNPGPDAISSPRREAGQWRLEPMSTLDDNENEQLERSGGGD